MARVNDGCYNIQAELSKVDDPKILSCAFSPTKNNVKLLES